MVVGRHRNRAGDRHAAVCDVGRLSLPAATRVWRPAAACAAMALLVWLLGSAPLVTQLAAGAAAYVAALTAAGVLQFRGGVPAVNV